MNTLYSQLCRRLILPVSDWLSKQQVMSYFAFVEQAQWWDRDRLEKIQNDNLVETVRAAYEKTLFYRQLFDQNKLKPSDIRNATDLSKLPIVTKDMLRGAYPDACTIKSGMHWQEAFTSGSTGRPFVVRIDSHSLSIARALMLLRASFSGWEIGDSVFQTGMTLNRGIVKRLKDILLRVSYVSAFDLSDGTLDQYLDLIDKKKHQYIMGYASSLYCLAQRAAKVGYNAPLKGAVSWGDNMFPHYRALIEKQFNIKVTDTYGCGEGIQVAAQCNQNDGEYHIFTPHVIVEFVDDHGASVPEGDMGEIVLTRLNPGAMPLIRYQIGDVGRGSAKESCACGRGFKMMRTIEGRNSDIIHTPNGNKLIVHFFTGIFEYITTIDCFQVFQEKIDEIQIKIVPLPGFSEADCSFIKKEIHEKGDPDLMIVFDIVDNIPLEKSNKRRFVVSNI